LRVGRWLKRRQAGLVGAGLIVACTLVPLATVFWTVPSARDVATAAGLTDLISYPAQLMAALLVYVHTRVSPATGSARVAAALLLVTSQGIAYAVLRLALTDEISARPGWLTMIELAVGGVLVWLLAARRPLPGDPLVVGLGLGILASAARLVLVVTFDPLPRLQSMTPVVDTVVLALYATAAVLLVRRGGLPRRASYQLGAVLVLLGLGHTLTYPTPPDDARSVLAVATVLISTALFCWTAWSLLQRTLRQTARSDQLEELLEQAEQEVRHDRTRLHQVASAAAGISSASQLLASGALGDPADRDRMVRMLAIESARLQRLSAGGPPDPHREFDIDDVLAPLVDFHLARGRRVEWQPSGARVVGCPDRVAEIIGILLDNSADHSGISDVRIKVSERSDGKVAITVSDRGRGIEPEVLARGFAWGMRGRDSSGHGIGLHEAHRLAADLGGSLSLTGSPGRGTSVTLTLCGAATALSGESRGA
jgi:signal transduction histidine kinase